MIPGNPGRLIYLLFLLAAVAVPATAQDASPVVAESPLNFELPGSNGRNVAFPEEAHQGPTVICFLGTECPLARLYAPRLAELAAEFGPQGVRFIGIDSNSQDSLDEVRRFVADHKLPFPVAKDYDNAVADRLNATRVTEVVVVDADTRIRYRGRIDDQYRPGIARGQAERQDLRIALGELVAGKKVGTPVSEVVGCLIGRVKQVTKESKVTYCKEVSRILQANCVECHRSGEIAPFALTDYDEVVGWADAMLETIDDGRMPPWHASPEHGQFANARFMAETDKQKLREWVAAGAPYGDVTELPAPLPPATTWRLDREPDAVIPMRDRPFAVPAEGIIEYQYFVVDPGFTEDKWIIGAEVIPGSRAAVHHAIVFVRPPDGKRFRGVSWITAYVPGQRNGMLPPGHGRLVPAGSTLVFQMHYTPNGTEQSDLSKVGLLFGKDADITHEVYSEIGLEQEFEIPPHTANYAVDGAPRRLPRHGTLLAVAPHMHLRGKSFRLWSQKGDERSVLLDVPRYDFNWQHVYAFAQPLPLDSIDKLEFTTTFDNSEANPVNPNPADHVTWGDQTWEEMAVAFFEIAVPRQRGKSADSGSTAQPADEQRRQSEIEQFATDFFERFDANRDGQIVRSELPVAIDRFAFRQLDRDGNERLSRAEVEQAAAQRTRF
ncbi:thiol-disulfide oxidoreductase [Caulifigura coniformis]|uniref:Thiol-disulfide oxidoreductase n=2 Tax=Caulifigura coniformis TaxID=2527983 RepID=A0A517SDS6_9PLAN|nr:thiol-disulfide oxidoreductase [Caulifigura coniformis]